MGRQADSANASFYEVRLCQPLSYLAVCSLPFFRLIPVSGLAACRPDARRAPVDQGRDASDPEPPSIPSTCREGSRRRPSPERRAHVVALASRILTAESGGSVGPVDRARGGTPRPPSIRAGFGPNTVCLMRSWRLDHRWMEVPHLQQRGTSSCAPRSCQPVRGRPPHSIQRLEAAMGVRWGRATLRAPAADTDRRGSRASSPRGARAGWP